MGSIGAPELLIVLVVVLVIFGGSKLPSLARNLGEAGREFRKGTAERDEPAAAAHPFEAAAGESVPQQLERLATLRSQGTISEEEFQALKAKLVS